MSLKEKVDFLKEEISTEEKFFEGFFKLEKIWKKYKVAIIGVVSISIVAFAGLNIKAYLETQNKIKANIAFNTLLDDPQNIGAKKVLKDLNPQLLTIALYLKNKENKLANIQFLDKISEFNAAIEKNDLDSINKIILNSKFLLKEYALFQKALIQTLNENYVDAKETLALIPANSAVSQLSNKLKHYLLTK